jgi:hypothetical protein
LYLTNYALDTHEFIDWKAVKTMQKEVGHAMQLKALMPFIGRLSTKFSSPSPTTILSRDLFWEARAVLFGVGSRFQ